MKIYTSDYLSSQYDYICNTNTCYVTSSNDEIPYIVEINKNGMFCYGAKYESYHKNNSVSCSDVAKLLQLNNNEIYVFTHYISTLNVFNDINTALMSFKCIICDKSSSLVNDDDCSIMYDVPFLFNVAFTDTQLRNKTFIYGYYKINNVITYTFNDSDILYHIVINKYTISLYVNDECIATDTLDNYLIILIYIENILNKY
jgi:hypothetical protein